MVGVYGKSILGRERRERRGSAEDWERPVWLEHGEGRQEVGKMRLMGLGEDFIFHPQCNRICIPYVFPSPSKYFISHENALFKL